MTPFEEARQLLVLLDSDATLEEDELAGIDAKDPWSGGQDLKRSEQRIQLFDYQEDLCRQMLRVSEQQDGVRLLLSLPTGAGKTRTAMSAVLENLKSAARGRWLWIAPTLELVEQAHGTLVHLWRSNPSYPDLRVMVRDRPDDTTDVWLTTPQAVNSFKGTLPDFTNVVFDEAHMLGAPTFKAAVQRSMPQGGNLFGLSATPGRASGKETESLVRFFGGDLLTSRILGKDPVAALQKRGILSRLSFRLVGERGQVLSHERRLRGLVSVCLSLGKKQRRTLAFSRSVGEAIAVAAHLRSLGVPAGYVDGRLSESERAERLEEFARGQVRVLLNQKLLATGYDCPAVSDVVLGTRVGSSVLFEQMVGRAARGPLTGGAALARVWEFDDHLAIHGLPSSYYRYRDYEWG